MSTKTKGTATTNTTVADVLRRYGPEYVRLYQGRMPVDHHKVLGVLSACRTFQLGTVQYACTACGRRHMLGRSCGNRHCATCQQDKGRAWLEKQTKRLLPCSYFLVTFTVPQEIRRFIRAHSTVCYEAMFAAAAAAMKTLAKNPRHLGSDRIGMTGVLHTWGRALDYHPHVHFIVPGGAISQDKKQWNATAENFWLPVRALSVLFREKFRAELRKHDLLDQVATHCGDEAWNQPWIAHSQPVGDGRKSLQYLAPYVFRVAITDRRVMTCRDTADNQGEVVFLHRRSGSRRYRSMKVTAMEFIRRFLQHVLPKGFVKVRHYGYLAAASQTQIDRIRWLIALANLEQFALVSKQLVSERLANPKHTQAATSKPRIRCADCGAEVRVIAHYQPGYYRVPCFDTS